MLWQVEADMAAQLERVRDAERSAELSPIHELAVEEPMPFITEPRRRNVFRLFLSVAVAFLFAPDAHAIEGHCVRYCDTPVAPSRSYGGGYAEAMAYDLAGQLMAQAMQAAAEGVATAIAEAIAEDARRKVAWKAARIELLARQEAALDARNADRAQREQAHHQSLADAGLRMQSIIGDLMSQLGGPAARFADFQFAGLVATAPNPPVRVRASEGLRFDRGTKYSAPVDLRSESITGDRAIDPAEMKQGTPFAYGLEEKERIRERWDRMAAENLERMRQQTVMHGVREAAEEDLRQEVLRQQIGDALVESALENWQEDFD